MKISGDWFVLGASHHGADVARPQETLNPVVGGTEEGPHHRRHQNMRDDHAEVRDPPLPGHPGGHRVGGSRRLEADREEDHLPIRVGRRQIHGVQRRVNNPHVRALRLEPQQVAVGPGNTEHIAKRTKDDVGSRGDRLSPVNRLQRGHADRTARPVNQLDAVRQERVEAVLHDAVRLAAADLHDGPGPGRGPPDRGQQLFGRHAVAIFIEIFHGEGAFNSSSWFISSRNAKIRRASVSSSRDSAKPTWTST